jgi:hypothetical protein
MRRVILLSLITLASITVCSAATSCPTANLWDRMGVPGVNYYALPDWVTAPYSDDLVEPITWIQPADVSYQALEKNPAIVNTENATLPSIATRANDTYYFCMGLLVQGGVPPYTYTVENAPPGLTVNDAGNYGGIATTAGIYTNIIFCATDSANTTVCLAPRTQYVCSDNPSLVHYCWPSVAGG